VEAVPGVSACDFKKVDRVSVKSVVARSTCIGTQYTDNGDSGADRRNRQGRSGISRHVLGELHKRGFAIIETSEEIAARHRQVVRITSNHEQELPDASYGGVFSFVEFPNVNLIRKLIHVHHPHRVAKLLDQC